MKTIVTIYFLLIFFSCNESVDIAGHWHIKKVNSKEKDYIVMDISEDTIAYLGKNSISGEIEGIHDVKSKKLLFPGDCGVYHFEYSSEGNILVLKNYLENRVAEKCENNCCDKLLDFKKDIRINVSFLQVIFFRDTLSPIELSGNFEELIIGQPISPYDGAYAPGVKLELDGKFSEVRDIKYWIDVVRSKYSKRDRERIIFRIIADQNVTTDKLKPIIHEIRKKGENRIFLTCLKPDFKNAETMFEYLKIDEFSFGRNKKLNEVVR